AATCVPPASGASVVLADSASRSSPDRTLQLGQAVSVRSNMCAIFRPPAKVAILGGKRHPVKMLTVLMFKGLWNRRWRESNDPLRAALGNLEREVMDAVWQNGGTTVREVRSMLARPVAYTTVMTTLDRLFKKGFVARTRAGRAFVY